MHLQRWQLRLEAFGLTVAFSDAPPGGAAYMPVARATFSPRARVGQADGLRPTPRDVWQRSPLTRAVPSVPCVGAGFELNPHERTGSCPPHPSFRIRWIGWLPGRGRCCSPAPFARASTHGPRKQPAPGGPTVRQPLTVKVRASGAAPLSLPDAMSAGTPAQPVRRDPPRAPSRDAGSSAPAPAPPRGNQAPPARRP